ncbi:uncharacterized protein LOC142976618 isoform X2 [Anticarsia gemmatalis]|uniref:uncharacterized protein LOC142976618 isoform X2 n=1 Tax=Anticarsia gemmatalis TaxID=129554 RepID=UPI003F7710E4
MSIQHTIKDYHVMMFLVLRLQLQASDISLDYYFGFDEALRSAKYIENCNGDQMQESCQQQCGPNHACLLGKCFCAEVKPQLKEQEKLRLESQANSGGSSGYEPSSESDSKDSLEVTPKYLKLNDLMSSPILRHHIAHFCPNLDVARVCIKKCMLENKAAFCGKDHVCYCGHEYGSPNDKRFVSQEGYGAFYDLYEKYFGPKANGK